MQKTTIGITTRTRAIKLSGLILLLLLFHACDTAMVYDTWETVPENNWHKDSILVFNPDISDTVNAMNIVLGVRNTKAYPYSNLWFFITTESPSGVSRKDTFQVELASPFGKWHGAGWGNTYTSLHYFRQNMVFDESGEYTILVQHGMRKDGLKGVNAIGYRIEDTAVN